MTRAWLSRNAAALIVGAAMVALTVGLLTLWRGGQAAAQRERDALTALRTAAEATDSALATVARLRADSARTARTIDSLWQVAADLRRAKVRTVTRWRDAVAVSVVDSVPCDVRIAGLVAAGDSVAAVAEASITAHTATVMAWRAAEDSAQRQLATLAAQLDTARAAQRVAVSAVRRSWWRRLAGSVGRGVAVAAVFTGGVTLGRVLR